MRRQLDLFASPVAPSCDWSFARLRRHALAHGAWVDHVPAWVTGHDALFDALERGADWSPPCRSARRAASMGGTCQRTWRHDA